MIVCPGIVWLVGSRAGVKETSGPFGRSDAMFELSVRLQLCYLGIERETKLYIVFFFILFSACYQLVTV